MEDVIPIQGKVLTLDLSKGKDECNLAEWPLTLLSDRVPEGVNTLEFCDTIHDPKTQKPVARRLTVHASDKYGLPTPKDEEILLGLIQLSKASKFSDRTVHFSRHQLLHLLGWPDTGQSYRRIGEALQRWVFVGLEYENAWWDNQAKSWVTESFHILERVSLYENERKGRQKQQAALPFSTFTWNEVLFRSFQNGYLKQLDLRKYFELSTSTARRMFRFLDKRFFHKSRWEFELRKFAFEHIGLSRDYHTGKIKEKLAPAIHELEASNYLEPLSPADRYVKLSRGEWKVVFVRKGSPKAVAKEPDDFPAIGKELVARGVTAKTAAELATEFGADRVERQLDVFDWLTSTNDPRIAQNPAGYLVQSIRDDYAPPKGYEPKAEREHKKQAAEARKQKQAEAKRKEQAENAAVAAQRDHVARFLAALGEGTERRKAFEEQATANADPKTQEIIRARGAFASAALHGAMMAEVLRVCPVGDAKTEA